MTYKLHLRQDFPFAQCPCIVELDGEKILLNNVILPKHIDIDSAYNPHNVRLWVIGTPTTGAVCAVWASHEQEALDEVCDLNMLDAFKIEDQSHDNENGEFVSIGNAGELFDLQDAWLGVVEFDASRDIALIVAIVRAVENQKDTLE